MSFSSLLSGVARHLWASGDEDPGRQGGGRWRWFKWLIHYVVQWWLRPRPPKKVGEYASLSQGVRRSGFVATAAEWEVDQLRPGDGDEQGEWFLYGGNSSGWQLAVCWSRGNATVCLRLPAGRSFVLPRHPDGRHPEGIPPSLKLTCISPFRRSRVSYNGWLREKGSSRLVHVKFSFTFAPNALLHHVPLDSTPAMAADCLSLHRFSCPRVQSLRMMGSVERYEQCGMLLGTLKIAGEEETELSLWGLRSRDKTRIDVDQLKGDVQCFGMLPNGLTVLAGATALEPDVPHLQHGCIIHPNRTRQLLEASNVVVGRRVQKLSVAAGRSRQTWELQPVEDFTTFHGPQWELASELAFVSVSLGGKAGHGFVRVTARPNQLNVAPPPLRVHTIKETTLSSLSAPPLVTSLEDSACRCLDLTGGKGASLGMLRQLAEEMPGRFSVPDGLVITTVAYRLHLQRQPHLLGLIEQFLSLESGNLQMLKKHCQRVAEEFEKTSIDAELKKDIFDHIESKFGESVRLAVRSSALGEDGEETSAAGQMTTVLGVQGLEKVLEAIVKCWASQFQLVALQYKLQHGMPLDPGMAVVVQEMVPADIAGVTFTRDPVTGDPSTVIITANYGLGESVVSATCEPDTVQLARDTTGLSIRSVHVGIKGLRTRMDEIGGTLEEILTEEESQRCCLTELQSLKLGELAVEVEEAFNSPRDLEWAVAGDDIYLLQARAITTLQLESDFDITHELDTGLTAEFEYLTRANLGEVMPGALTPLTYDVIMRGYDHAFKEEFLKELGGRRFELNPLIASLLLYSSFQCFMSVLDFLLAKVDKSKKLSDRLWEISFFGRLVEDRYLDAAIERNGIVPRPFISSVLCHLGSYLRDRRGLKLAKSVYVIDADQFLTAKALYEEITDHLYDSFKTILYHRSNSEMSTVFNMLIIEKLAPYYDGNIEAILRDIAWLLSNSSNLESADVPSSLQSLAVDIIRSDRREEFIALDVKAATEMLKQDGGHLGRSFRTFISRHAHRSFKELDFSSRPWGENQENLVKSLQRMARNTKLAAMGGKQQLNAWDALDSIQFKPSFLQKLNLWYLARCARRSVMLREKSKSWLVKTQNYFRQPLRRLGQLLRQEGKLPDSEMILYLTYDEVTLLVEAHAPHIVNKARHRRRLFQKMNKCIFPEITSGIPRAINADVPKFDGEASVVLTGITMSQGIVQAPARVIVDFEDVDQIRQGEILVTYSTDVGWSPYFPLLAGVVTELGGLMSHGSVVAREYGLPCLVGVQGATAAFKSGDTVLLDASKGILKKIDSNQ